jgi:hypothetical protein
MTVKPSKMENNLTTFDDGATFDDDDTTFDDGTTFDNFDDSSTAFE